MMSGGGGGVVGGGASGVGAENGRMVAHDFLKGGAPNVPCMSKTAGAGLTATGM